MGLGQRTGEVEHGAMSDEDVRGDQPDGGAVLPPVRSRAAGSAARQRPPGGGVVITKPMTTAATAIPVPGIDNQDGGETDHLAAAVLRALGRSFRNQFSLSPSGAFWMALISFGFWPLWKMARQFRDYQTFEKQQSGISPSGCASAAAVRTAGAARAGRSPASRRRLRDASSSGSSARSPSSQPSSRSWATTSSVNRLIDKHLRTHRPGAAATSLEAVDRRPEPSRT
jgi:hypothetical protein